MVIRTWLLALLLVGIMLTACSQETEPSVADEEDDSVTMSHNASILYEGALSTEETILQSDTIARVEFLGMATSTATSTAPATFQDSGTSWLANLEFRFRVLEYLKGSGPTEIVAIVTAALYEETEAQARAILPWMETSHNTRWDDREAIVFLNSEWDQMPSLRSAQDRYFMSHLTFVSDDAYTVASPHSKKWLPAADAAPSGGARGGSSGATDKLFLLDAPGPGGGGTTQSRSPGGTLSEAATAPTISLSAMKNLIRDIEAEATAGGTDEYRACVQEVYYAERIIRYRIERDGTAGQRNDYDIGSGQPAGTVIHHERFGIGKPPHNIGRWWFEGRDKDLVRYEGTDFEPYTWGDGPFANRVRYTQRVVTARPLPAGVYHYYLNGMLPWRLPCNGFSEVERNLVDNYLTVTAPVNVVHEAFFDPVAIGAAVGADSANGVLRPNSFTLDGATTTISSLKWEDGAVTMTLNPTASLADYAIDFIDVTGTTTVSLTSDNASTTPLAWTVPDKPWSDGDLLMLRIHKHISTDATLSALALSGIDLAFDPATTTYTASVPATTTQTTVTPTTNHGSATYVVKLGGVVDDDGTIPLAAGANVVSVEVTAEDGSTTQTYTVTVTRATPSEPITVTLTPRVEGSETYVNLTIEWNDPQPCDGQYMVALYSTSDYLVRFMGFHPTPATTSLSRETYLWWDLRFLSDYWAGVSCDPSDYSGRRELGRVSLRAAHPDNN